MKIHVRLKKTENVSYPVIVESGLFKKIPSLLKKAKLGPSIAIITDEKVKKLYGNKLLEHLRKEGFRASVLSIPESETSKNWRTIGDLCEKMAAMNIKRDACVLALGGGVVGDIAGFVASIFMRGIPFVQIPTTLLAMIDSSIGGKTGVDLEHGKNLVGTFHQPKMVLIDPEMLRTLPRKEFRNGLAEMAKHAIIASQLLFVFMAKNFAKMTSFSPLFEKLIAQNIKIKTRFVQQDEKESLKKTVKKKLSRMTLNYGHTVGHAIEKLEDYKIPHGEAVSIGMVLENRIAVNKKMLSEKEALLIKLLLAKLGLPTKLPADISLKSVERTMQTDKKFVGGKLLFALPRKIGKVEIISL